MPQFDNVELYDIMMTSLDLLQEEIHTAMPGQVTAYDSQTQLADVQLMIKKPQFDDADNRLDPVSFPVLPKVPVRWPQAGGFAFVLPMQIGDFVWVTFSELGTGEFRTTGQESEPLDIGRHTITYPYCSPGAPPDNMAITDNTVQGGTGAMIGQIGTTNQITITHGGIQLGGPTVTDAMALASKVNDNLTAITNFLTAIFPSPGTTTLICAGSGSPATGGPTGPVPTMSDVSSPLVKTG